MFATLAIYNDGQNICTEIVDINRRLIERLN